jgi:hypothetical protein
MAQVSVPQWLSTRGPHISAFRPLHYPHKFFSLSLFTSPCISKHIHPPSSPALHQESDNLRSSGHTSARRQTQGNFSRAKPVPSLVHSVIPTGTTVFPQPCNSPYSPGKSVSSSSSSSSSGQLFPPPLRELADERSSKQGRRPDGRISTKQFSSSTKRFSLPAPLPPDKLLDARGKEKIRGSA